MYLKGLLLISKVMMGNLLSLNSQVEIKLKRMMILISTLIMVTSNTKQIRHHHRKLIMMVLTFSICSALNNKNKKIHLDKMHWTFSMILILENLRFNSQVKHLRHISNKVLTTDQVLMT